MFFKEQREEKKSVQRLFLRLNDFTNKPKHN